LNLKPETRNVKPSRIRIGTRASALARWQANWVAEQLQSARVEVDLVPITTAGDRDQTGPIGAIGTAGVFTKELQRALLDGRIDLAVHSLKDLPTESIEGLSLAAVPPRDSAGDALLSRNRLRLAELPQRATVGTGSLRRQSQLLFARPDLLVSEIRGNVETRIARLKEGQFDAIVLAEAGLTRLGLREEIAEVLPKSLMLPAIGQGALGLEARADDPITRAVVERLDDRETHTAVLAERSLLAALSGGCLAPVGAWARVEQNGELRLTAAVLSRDGKRRLVAEATDEIAEAVQLGRRVAADLLAQGAASLIASSRAPIT
jgi:hydroxymethylbilane synthase